MRLRDFLAYDDIVIQCHDNPDADALSSGFGVYRYLKNNGKQVRFVYGGSRRITKSNLLLMIKELHIPVEHVESLNCPDLLINVDCQYGESNVTRFEAKKIAVIDHHQISGKLPEMSLVRSNQGACATIIWGMLKDEGIDVNEDTLLVTALYYGLMTDTGNFTEIHHPLDRDLRDDAKFDRALITRFRNANISLQELKIAGTALLNYKYNPQYRFAVVSSAPCDPNILGMISDLMLEVDAVDTCLVYSRQTFGIKVSVRSCIKEVRANELAAFITEGIGNGGGHIDKAGGFIQTDLLKKAYDEYCLNRNLSFEDEDTGIAEFLNWQMIDYFDDIEIIRAADYTPALSLMQTYHKKRIPVGYVEADKVFPIGGNICVRTMEADLNVTIHEGLYLMIGMQGEVYPNERDKFELRYERLDTPYVFDGEYDPVVKDETGNKTIPLLPYAKACITTDDVKIYAKELDHRVKVFTEWDKDRYMLGKEGDFLIVRTDAKNDVYVLPGDVFKKTYEKT